MDHGSVGSSLITQNPLFVRTVFTGAQRFFLNRMRLVVLRLTFSTLVVVVDECALWLTPHNWQPGVTIGFKTRNRVSNNQECDSTRTSRTKDRQDLLTFARRRVGGCVPQAGEGKVRQISHGAAHKTDTVIVHFDHHRSPPESEGHQGRRGGARLHRGRRLRSFSTSRVIFINSYLEEIVGPVNLLKTVVTLADSFHYRPTKFRESL
jgi:hypothetical protein